MECFAVLTSIDTELHPEIAKNIHKDLTVHPIYKSPEFLNVTNPALFVFTAPLKAIWQFWALWLVLAHEIKPARFMIVQNPPSIPVLAVCAVMCWLRKTQLVIDWHNTGYSILALKMGRSHPFVKLSKAYEKYFSSSARINFAVSDAMRRQLKRDFNIKAPLLRLYDRPTSDFHLISPEERLEFLSDMDLPAEQQAALEKGALKVLVSSTSWTPDEDFSLLLDSLVEYSKVATTSNTTLPELLVVITGKGPQKSLYLDKIDELEKGGKLKKVDIKTAWLPTAAYAMLLASADLGVSLHKSSSGVDLPMKVVDMFGAGLPVVGYSLFESWSELVKEGVNGRGFGTSEELTSILVQLLGGDGKKLKTLKEGVLKERDHDWDTEWGSCAGDVFGLNDRPQEEETTRNTEAIIAAQTPARNLHFGAKPAHATDASS